MTVTIKDVAEKAGVSVTTVSRVLNNRGYLSEQLKHKVNSAMEELNYHPSEVARSLLRKKSNIIGLILPDISHPFFGEVTKHIEAYAYEQGYKLMLCNSLHHKKKEKEYIDLLRASRVDGIIMGSHTMSVSDYKSINLPLVSLDRQISKTIPFIASDNYQGGVLATRLLLRKKCKSIAYLSGNLRLNLLAKQRHDAFLEQVSGQEVDYTVRQTDLNGFKYKDYEKLVSSLFQERPELDGVFASSDMLAMQVLKQCRQLGRAVPDQVKVVGYDGIAALEAEDLTTIVQPIKQMGELAVQYLLQQIAGEPVPPETILPVRLSEKGTT